MRTAGLLALAILFFPAFAQAAVVINEIAWMGTAVSSSDEWIELVNDGGTPVDITGWILSIEGKKDIILSGNITAGGFYLIERTDDTTVPAIPADLVASFGTGLANTGEILSLKDAGKAVIDRVDGSQGWNIGGAAAGNNTTKETAQRTGSGWITAAPTPRAANTGGPSDSSTTASSTPSASSSSGGATTYVPPPLAISVDGGPDMTALVEVPIALSALVKTKGGAADSSASIHWSFGDGSSAEGSTVTKLYRYAGTYLAVVTASDGAATGRDDLVVTVRSAHVRIPVISSEGITIANDSAERLDLSGWRILADATSFRIPEGTALLPAANVLFPFSIMNMPVTFDAALFYPDGIIAARYAPPVLAAEAAMQLPESASSSNEVQTVESVPSTNISGTAHEDTAVSAPAPVSNKETGAGAAILPAQPLAAAVTAKTPVTGLLHSPWTLSFLGVIALAGGAFIFL